MRLLSYLAPGFPASLFATLAAVIDAEVSFDEATSGPAPGVDPFLDQSADLGWICSTSFVELSERTPEPSVQLVGVAWVPDDEGSNGQPVYFGDLVTRPDSAIACFEDVRGTRVGCNDAVSLSGHYSFRFAATARGLDPDSFADLVFTGGHHQSLDLLLAGHLDAAVVDSVVLARRARTDAAAADLRVVERLGPWPVQPLVARATMPVDEVARIQQLLLAANDRPEVVAALADAGLSHLVAVSPEHYDVVSAAMSSQGE
ncbi:MAG: PhnD/SsuA/transferrin family substrate-binding protein [Acidimicrobiales bacterium]